MSGEFRGTVGWRFKDVLAIICSLNPDDKPETTASRIKQWQKMGIACLPRVGRGTKVEYTDEMVWQIALINSMQRIGIPPQAAWHLITRHLDDGEIRHELGTITLNTEIIVEAIKARAALSRALEGV